MVLLKHWERLKTLTWPSWMKVTKYKFSSLIPFTSLVPFKYNRKLNNSAFTNIQYNSSECTVAHRVFRNPLKNINYNKREISKRSKPQDKGCKWKHYSPLTGVIKLFISINEFSHFYASNSLPHPTEEEQGSSFMGMSCWLQLSHNSR